MSTWLIVVIIVAVIVLLALVVAATRGRKLAAERRRERELARRRERAAGEHREAAQARVGAAEEAEHRARLANAVAERERADAQLHEERARAHERGLADDDLMREDRTTRDETVTDDARYERGTGSGRVAEGDGLERGRVAQEPPADGGRMQDVER